MRLNPYKYKCTFDVREGKFLGFYLMKQGMEATQDKFTAFTKTQLRTELEEVDTKHNNSATKYYKKINPISWRHC